MLAAAAFLAAGAPLPAASSAEELAPPAAFLELGRSVEGFAKLDPNAEDPSEAQSQTVDRAAMVTAWNRRYGDWYKKNNLKDCPCLLYTSPSPRDQRGSRMPSSA